MADEHDFEVPIVITASRSSSVQPASLPTLTLRPAIASRPSGSARKRPPSHAQPAAATKRPALLLQPTLSWGGPNTAPASAGDPPARLTAGSTPNPRKRAHEGSEESTPATPASVATPCPSEVSSPISAPTSLAQHVHAIQAAADSTRCSNSECRRSVARAFLALRWAIRSGAIEWQRRAPTTDERAVLDQLALLLYRFYGPNVRRTAVLKPPLLRPCISSPSRPRPRGPTDRSPNCRRRRFQVATSARATASARTPACAAAPRSSVRRC